MGLTPAPEKKDNKGIALFMVIASMSVLSILVTEFTYVAQMNQTLAFDGLDQLKAHYLAKSGFKLSLLRLKAFKHVKETLASLGGDSSKGANPGAAVGISSQMIDKIWSFPFYYPIPTEIPGLTASQKDAINKFQKESSIDGKLSAVIDSESGKYNLNSLHEEFNASPSPSPSASATGTPGGGGPPTPSPSPSPFSPDEARTRLKEFMLGTLNSKIEADQEFAEQYRDFKFEDFMENLFSFADRLFERKTAEPSEDLYPAQKRGAFVTVSELHLIPLMDDNLYDLFAPVLTAAPTAGIHINTMQEATLKAIVPGIKAEEVTEFFKFRDSTEQDQSFKSPDDFFNYLQKNVELYQRSGAVDQLKKDFEKKGIRLVIDENQYKITVKATVNHATRLLEAWVTLGDAEDAPKAPPKNGQGQDPQQPPAGAAPPPQNGAPPPKRDPGVRITFMRLL